MNASLKAVATGEARGRAKTIFDYLDEPRVQQGLSVVAGKFLDAPRMLKLCINAVKKTPELLKCDPLTVLGAMMTSTALGLEPNTIQQQAFLLPYKRRAKVGNQWTTVVDCQFQVGYRGFITMAYRSPRVKALRADAIHENDLFEHMVGTENFLRFAKTLKDRGELIGSFCHVQLADGFEVACVLPLDEIHKIRSKSQTYETLLLNVEQAENDKDRAYQAKKLADTPWVLWEDDMATKSAIKKIAKHLPIASSDLLMAAGAIDSSSDIGRLDLKTMVDPDAVRAVMNGEGDVPQLEHDPVETIDDDGVIGQRQGVQVPVSEAGAAAAGNHDQAQGQGQQHQVIDPADRPDAGADPQASPQQEQGQQGSKAAAGKAKPQPEGPSYAQLSTRLTKAADRDVALLILDESRHLPKQQQNDLVTLFNQQFPEE